MQHISWSEKQQLAAVLEDGQAVFEGPILSHTMPLLDNQRMRLMPVHAGKCELKDAYNLTNIGRDKSILVKGAVLPPTRQVAGRPIAPHLCLLDF